MSVFDALRRAVRDNPPIYLLWAVESEAAELRALEKRIRVIAVFTEVTFFSFYNESSSCDFSIAPMPPIILQDALMLHPSVNQTIIDQLNTAIILNYRMIKTILERDVKKGNSIYERCRRDKFEHRVREAGDPIHLMRLSGSFGTLFTGLAIATCCYLSEHIVKRYT